MYRSALAWFCTNWLLAAVAGAEPAAAPVSEALLARGPAVYLRLDLGASVLEIKTRGRVLKTLPCRGAIAMRWRPAGEAREQAELVLPSVWTVAEDVAAPWRRRLGPLSGTAQPPPLPELLTGYGARLEDGWWLEVQPQVAATGFWSRLRQRFWSGLAARSQKPQPRSPVWVLALAPEEARQLLPRLRPGTRILVVGPS